MDKYKIVGKQDLFNRRTVHCVLDQEGTMVPGYKSKLSKKEVLELYKYIVMSRVQDEAAMKFQRQGRMLTFAPNIGEEAYQVSTAHAMNLKHDVFCPGYRVNAALLKMGVSQETLLLYWSGNENGSKFPKEVQSLPLNITIGCQYSHAAGAAYALKQRGVPGAAVTFVGNGGTSEGETYEAMNMAQIHKWPVVFCVNNNQWAISTPERESTQSPTIAVKGIAAGIPGIRLDGNDIFASFDGMKEALHYAKNYGPILVEFLTYRKGPHTTSDNPKIYRTPEQEEIGNDTDPIIRLKKYLLSNKEYNWTEEKDLALHEEMKEQVKTSFNKMMEKVNVNIDEVFDYTYKTLPKELQDQKDEAKKFFQGKK